MGDLASVGNPSGIFNLGVINFNSESHLAIVTIGHYWQWKTQIVFNPGFIDGIEIENSQFTNDHVVNDVWFADLDDEAVN